jgi:hypothetical protein
MVQDLIGSVEGQIGGWLSHLPFDRVILQVAVLLGAVVLAAIAAVFIRHALAR